MEQFNNQYEEEVKEKSIYLVHLDNARILILVSVFVGIIALSFLIGMKFSGGPSDSIFPDSASQKEVLESQIESQKEDDLDALLAKEDSLDSLDSLDDELMKEDAVVTPEKAENIVPEKKESKPVVAKTTTPKKTATAEPKKKVVAVSVDNSTRSHVQQESQPVRSTKGFSIQIASFDTKNKAARESDTINRMNYDSFVATATVQGKTYYRVKIGPFANKSEAFATLENLQSTTRYKDSYITFEK